MAAGDGLLVRVRPRQGQLSPTQLTELGHLSKQYGQGSLELTSRAHVQLRGLSHASYPSALERLNALDLLDTDMSSESRRNVLVAPYESPEGIQLAAVLEGIVPELPELPSKFGFSVDTGPHRYLASASADLRIERSVAGRLMLRADGAATGREVPAAKLPSLIKALCTWFLESGGGPRPFNRMRKHLARRPLPSALAGEALPRATLPPPSIGQHEEGWMVGVRYGRVSSAKVQQLAQLPGLKSVHLTPWRRVLLKGAAASTWGAQCAEWGFITNPDDPSLRISVCVGAPGCDQAHQSTLDLADRLAPRLAAHALTTELHISGCSKGCARPEPAPITFVGTPDGFNWVRHARADAEPWKTQIVPEKVLEYMPYTYLTDGAEIYQRSFTIIRAEAELNSFSPEEEPIVVRMIHALGMVGLEQHIQLSQGFVEAVQTALAGGKPIFCDTRMVAEGITQRFLSAKNPVICTLSDPEVPRLAERLSTTRTAAAVELWAPKLEGAIVAIGNAPTALFHLLNNLEDPQYPRPAAIIGCPVGFVGAVESKQALWSSLPVPSLVVNGRLGGSAVTVAAVNALALQQTPSTGSTHG